MFRSGKVSAHLLPLLGLFALIVLLTRLAFIPASQPAITFAGDNRANSGAYLFAASRTPTNTRTPRPSATASNTRTNTPVTPSATATNTSTNTPVTPSATPTNTFTNTARPPSATPTSTGTITATFTDSPTPTATRTPRRGSSSNDDNDDHGSSSDSGGVTVQTFLSSNLSAVTGGAITVTGGAGNVVLNGVTGDVYFHIIAVDGQVKTSLAEIGVESVIQRGVIQAVDLFGLLPNGVSVTTFIQPVYVCLRGSGSVIVLAAPDRAPIPLAVDPSSPAGYACASVSSAGIIVLVQ